MGLIVPLTLMVISDFCLNDTRGWIFVRFTDEVQKRAHKFELTDLHTVRNELNRTNTWRGFYSLSDVTVGTSHLFHAMRILVRLSLKKGRSFNSIRSLRNKSKSDAHFSKLPALGIGDSNPEF